MNRISISAFLALVIVGLSAQAQEEKGSLLRSLRPNTEFRVWTDATDRGGLLAPKIDSKAEPEVETDWGLKFRRGINLSNSETGREASIKEFCTTPKSQEPEKCRIEFEGIGVSAGLQTIFGHRTGERINMGLLRLSTGMRFGLDPNGDKDQFARVEGEIAGSRDADAIVPGQQDAEYYQGRAIFGSDVLGRRDSDYLAGQGGVLNWQIEYERIGNSPTGLEKLDAVTLTPIRFSCDDVRFPGFSCGNVGVAASVGMRFEDSYFDRNYMAQTAPGEDASLHNVGLVCDVSAYWESQRNGFQILGNTQVFVSDLQEVRRWQGGLEMTAPLLRGAKDCRIGIGGTYQDNKDPTQEVTWFGVMGSFIF